MHIFAPDHVREPHSTQSEAVKLSVANMLASKTGLCSELCGHRCMCCEFCGQRCMCQSGNTAALLQLQLLSAGRLCIARKKKRQLLKTVTRAVSGSSTEHCACACHIYNVHALLLYTYTAHALLPYTHNVQGLLCTVHGLSTYTCIEYT